MAALMADNSAVHHWNLHGAQGGDSLSLCLPRVRDWYRQSGERPVCPRVRPSPPKPALAAKCPHTPAACLAKCFGNTVSRRSRGSASSLCVFPLPRAARGGVGGDLQWRWRWIAESG